MKTDVLHLIDQRKYGTNRDDWCILGEGLMCDYLPRIKSFTGKIVLEFEDVEMAVESRNRLLV